MAAPKNASRGKRSSSKRRRREEQLDLFPQEPTLASATRPLHAGRRAAPESGARRERADSGAAIQLGLH